MRLAPTALLPLALLAIPVSAQQGGGEIATQIRQHCVEQWEEDFAMRAYCEREQQRAVLRIGSFLNTSGMPDAEGRQALALCLERWPGDYSMIAYCLEEQDGGYEELRETPGVTLDADPAAQAAQLMAVGEELLNGITRRVYVEPFASIGGEAGASVEVDLIQQQLDGVETWRGVRLSFDFSGERAGGARFYYDPREARTIAESLIAILDDPAINAFHTGPHVEYLYIAPGGDRFGLEVVERDFLQSPRLMGVFRPLHFDGISAFRIDDYREFAEELQASLGQLEAL